MAGFWHEDLAHGKGKKTCSNGAVTEGYWDQGKYIGASL